MSAATVDLLRLKMFLKRKADRQRRGKIFDACRHSDTRAQQFVVAADDRGAADFAAVDERQHHEVAAFVQGQLIFERRRKAAFAAEKTFLVAAHAVAAAYVKSVRRRIAFGKSNSADKSSRGFCRRGRLCGARTPRRACGKERNPCRCAEKTRTAWRD